jgi:hypothetical protein
MKLKFPFMIKSFLVALLLISYLSAVSQSAKMKSSIGVSIPVIWNNSEATYYQLGSPKYRSGKARSYGLNIGYSHFLYKGIYGKLGVGYFKQSFGIIRPFYYDSPMQFGWATDSYDYDNIQLYGGIGYKRSLSKLILINGNVTYNQYYSFRQKYINHSPVPHQVNHKSMSLGRMISLNLGGEMKISKRISIGVSSIFPVFIHWDKDEIFANNHYSSDEQQIARNKFSAGIVVSCNYNF